MRFSKDHRPMERGLHLEEIGEGWLAISGDGQGVKIFQSDLIAKINAPTHRDRVDTAHLTRLDGTDFVQWYGRKADGRFHPIGRILRLTKAGKKLLAEGE